MWQSHQFNPLAEMFYHKKDILGTSWRGHH
jgi:hypothetical protein